MNLTLDKFYVTNLLIRDKIADWYNAYSHPFYSFHEAIQLNNPGQYEEYIIECVANYWGIDTSSTTARQWLAFREIVQNTIKQAEAEYLGI